MSFYREQLESWLSTLDVKAHSVLDIGGKQGAVKDRVKSWQVDKYEILDLPVYDLNNQWDIVKPGADIIFCLEVFEYLIDPIQAMDNIKRLLLRGGKAYITFAFVYPFHEEVEADSLRYTENAIRRLVERTGGLTITNTWYRVDKSGLLQSFYATDKMHPAKGYIHHDATGFIVEVTK